MDIREELKSAGAYPTGPVSAWPKERHWDLMEHFPPTDKPQVSLDDVQYATSVKASPMRMAKGLARAAGSAIRHGKVSSEIREERYNTCKACPAFIEDSKRCSECGCFMEAKTWIGGNPNALCPLKKWSR